MKNLTLNPTNELGSAVSAILLGPKNVLTTPLDEVIHLFSQRDDNPQMPKDIMHEEPREGQSQQAHEGPEINPREGDEEPIDLDDEKYREQPEVDEQEHDQHEMDEFNENAITGNPELDDSEGIVPEIETIQNDDYLNTPDSGDSMDSESDLDRPENEPLNPNAMPESESNLYGVDQDPEDPENLEDGDVETI